MSYFDGAWLDDFPILQTVKSPMEENSDGPICDQNGALGCFRAHKILDKTLLPSVSNLVLINGK